MALSNAQNNLYSGSKAMYYCGKIVFILNSVCELHCWENEKSCKNKMKCGNVMNAFNALLHIHIEEWLALSRVKCMLTSRLLYLTVFFFFPV